MRGSLTHTGRGGGCHKRTRRGHLGQTRGEPPPYKRRSLSVQKRKEKGGGEKGEKKVVR